MAENASNNSTSLQDRPQQSTDRKVQKLPPFNVVLLDDDDHGFEYVILMLRRLFAHPETMAKKLTNEVDQTGRAIVYTTHRELAELKRDQILAFGADPRIAESRGSMSAVVEAAE